MAASHSTSKMLASMIGKGDRNTAKSATVSDVMSRETSDEFDELQPKLIAQPKLGAQPKPGAQQKPRAEMGQALTNILGPNATKQHSPMDKTSG